MHITFSNCYEHFTLDSCSGSAAERDEKKRRKHLADEGGGTAKEKHDCEQDIAWKPAANSLKGAHQKHKCAKKIMNGFFTLMQGDSLRHFTSSSANPLHDFAIATSVSTHATLSNDKPYTYLPTTSYSLPTNQHKGQAMDVTTYYFPRNTDQPTNARGKPFRHLRTYWCWAGTRNFIKPPLRISWRF